MPLVCKPPLGDISPRRLLLHVLQVIVTNRAIDGDEVDELAFAHVHLVLVFRAIVLDPFACDSTAVCARLLPWSVARILCGT